MKKTSMVYLIIMLTLFMTGCSKPDSHDSESQQTRVFNTVKGVVTIPASPQKIVSDYYLGEFLALGVKPMIASPYSLSNPYLEEFSSEIQALNIASSETALEMIIEAEPDLIVTISEADYENFSKIAPTVYIPYDDYGDEELFYYIAEMLGKKEQAHAYMDEYKTEVLSVKDEIREIVAGRTISFVEIWPGEVYVFGSHFARGGSILFDLWELEAPESVQQKMVDSDTAYEVISLELLPEYTGDFIFYGILAGADSNFVEQSAVWNALPAVQNGLVKSYEQVAFMHSDPITLKGQLEFYLDYFRSLEQ